jgi:anti-anti-sigma factor
VSDLHDLFIAISSHGPSGFAVTVAGPIHVGNAARLQEALLDALIATPTSLIVDLGSVSSIDGTGLDVLVGAHLRATAAGTQLLFRNPNAEVAHLIERHGLPTVAGAMGP